MHLQNPEKISLWGGRQAFQPLTIVDMYARNEIFTA
jgi:hypothetical protein